MHHDCFQIVLVHKGIVPHIDFPVDLSSSAATMNNVTASHLLFHNCTTTHHDCFCVHFDFTTNNVMASEMQMEWSALLNQTFDDALELSWLLVRELIRLPDPTEQ
jgi:hypothetical protein